MSPSGQLLGRNVLKAYRNGDNGHPLPLDRYTIGAILNKVLPLHQENANRIDSLHKFFRGNQNIKGRQKKVRSDITYNMVINYAYRVVEFYTGYTLSNNIQFLLKEGRDSKKEYINLFNDYYALDDGHNKNIGLAEWCLISGNGYKRTLANNDFDMDSSPYITQVIHPGSAFVVYAIEDGLPLLGGTIAKINTKNEFGKDITLRHIGVYTNTQYYEWVLEYDNFEFPDITKITPIYDNKINGLGVIPITEYVNNHNRIGLVEALIDLFNAVNLLGSNALENIEQIIQSYLIFLNVDLPEEVDSGGNKIKVQPKPVGDVISVKGVEGMPADVKLLSLVLDQSGVKTYMDILLDAMVDIGGVPMISSRAQAVSGGTTGMAEQTRGGWAHADAKAIKFLKLFASSELINAKVILNISRGSPNADFGNPLDGGLTLRDIDVKPTRNRLGNIQAIAQAWVAFDRTEKFDPVDIGKMLDLDDVEGMMKRGKEYWATEKAVDVKALQEELAELRKLRADKESLSDELEVNLET